MPKWEYSFAPTSKAEWIRQIEQDLNGKSIDTLQSEWWPGEPLLPLLHAEDASDIPVILPQALFSTPPALLEEIDLQQGDANARNQFLLQALSSGTERFLITGSPKENIDIDQLLNGVIADILQWHWLCPSDIIPHGFTALQAKAPNSCFVRFQRMADPVSMESIFNSVRNSGIAGLPIKLEYAVPDKPDFVASASQLFDSIVRDFIEWIAAGGSAMTFSNACLLRMKASPDYVRSIIEIRTLHVLWQNFINEINLDPVEMTDYMECHIYPDAREKADHYLIRATMSALAASLSGSGSLCIHHDGGQPDFFDHLHRNIHHLLHLESGLPKGEDPIGGSYAIDYYTRKWAERIWATLPI